MALEIKGFLETSFLDWDGKVVAVVYLPGCDFNCPFCHNRGLVDHPQDYPAIAPETIENYLLEHKEFVDGICITGGEPCLHKNRGLLEFIKKVKHLGFLVKLDTNGNDPEALKNLIDNQLVDYVAMDVKGPLDERYGRLAGVKVDLAKIKESIALLREGKVDYEFRTTVVPALLEEEDIEDIAQALSGAKRYVLQQFVAKFAGDEQLQKTPAYDKKVFEQLVRRAQPHVKNTFWRGIS